MKNLSHEDQKQFIINFYSNYKINNKSVDEFMFDILNNEWLKELIINREILKTICTIYYENAKLSKCRAKLYYDLIINLLKRGFNEYDKVLDNLEKIAYIMFSNNTNKVNEKELSDNKIILDKETINKMELCGLIVLKDREYIFQYPILQKYLTAKYFCNNTINPGKTIESFINMKDIVKFYIESYSDYQKAVCIMLIKKLINKNLIGIVDELFLELDRKNFNIGLDEVLLSLKQKITIKDHSKYKNILEWLKNS